MPDEPASREKPNCVATVLCNTIIEDRLTNSFTLVGLFNGVMAESLPSGFNLCALGSFADGRGVWRVLFRIRDPQRQVVFQAETEVNFVSPLEVYDIPVRLVNVLLRTEGVYDVDFLLDNEPVGHRSFRVLLKQAG